MPGWATMTSLCHSSRNRWTDALDAFEQSLEISQETGDIGQSAATYIHKAAVFLELGDSQVAASLCARGIEIFEETDFPLGIAEAYKVLGRLLTRKKEWATAQGLLEEGLRICEEYDDALGRSEIHRDLGNLHAARNDAAAARASYRTALEGFQTLGASYEVEATQAQLDAL